ncbi:MAG: DUF6157 family protein [Flavobacteriales bacterium]
MKTHTTNYTDTFILVADDCPVSAAEVPPLKGTEKTVAALQFEMIEQHPYEYTSDDVIFGVYAQRNGIQGVALDGERRKFFSKGQPCMRCSALGKRYGWGVHSNAEGKIALYPLGSEEYERLASDKKLKITRAMSSARKK